MSPSDAIDTQPYPLGEIKLKNKSCSQCGESFQCGSAEPNKTCWCSDGPHLPLEAIQQGVGCYCPSCLEKRRRELGLL